MITLTNETINKTFEIKTKNKNIPQVVYVFKKNNNLLDDEGIWKYDVKDDPPAEVVDTALFDKVAELTPNKGTARTYNYEIKKYLGTGGKLDSLEDITKYYESIEVKVREKFIYAVLKAHKALEIEGMSDKLRELARKSTGIVRLQRIERIKNLPKEETESKIQYEDIRKRAEALDNSNETYKFIALFYAMEGWRCDTVCHMTKDIKEKEMNIVRLIKRKIEMNHFKTIHSHGKKEVDISAELCSLMRKQFKRTGSRWLLPDSKDNDKPISANTLSKILKSIFDTGVQGIRHAYLTHGRKTLNNEEFYDLCFRYNTSVEMGEMVYNDSI